MQMQTPNDLPEVYVNEAGNNFREPVYLLHAEGYYGDSHWSEGERIVFVGTPNHTMQPLNRAAAEAVVKWQESLPLRGESVQQADLDEARRFLPKDQLEKLDGPTYHDTIFRTAVAIKHRRENKPGLILPSFTPRNAGASSAPPMPNANVADLRQGPSGFGDVSGSQTKRAAEPRAARTTRAMANTDQPAGA
jgi:hypothetical protein